MSLARLAELAKQESEGLPYTSSPLASDGWDWYSLKIHMSPTLWDRIMRAFPSKKASDDPYYNIEYGIPITLFGIRVVIDHGLEKEPLVWILVDPVGEELERGTVEPEQIMHSGELR